AALEGYPSSGGYQVWQNAGKADLVADSLFAPNKDALAFGVLALPTRNVECPPLGGKVHPVPTGLVVVEGFRQVSGLELMDREVPAGKHIPRVFLKCRFLGCDGLGQIAEPRMDDAQNRSKRSRRDGTAGRK